MSPTQPDPRQPAEPRIGWFAALSARYWRMPTVVVLIAANLIPLIGVVVWDWDLFLLMTAYWAETGIIGFYAMIRLAFMTQWAAVFYVPFFCIHFGGFMFGHFVFLFSLFADPAVRQITSIEEGVRTIVIQRGLWVALLALFISHGFSFYVNFLRPWFAGRIAPDNSNRAMSDPYARVAVLHITLIFGAALAQAFRTPTAAFVLLIALKTAIDIAAHVRANFSAEKE